jgi:hypothetical protein
MAAIDVVCASSPTLGALDSKPWKLSALCSFVRFWNSSRLSEDSASKCSRMKPSRLEGFSIAVGIGILLK